MRLSNSLVVVMAAAAARARAGAGITYRSTINSMCDFFLFAPDRRPRRPRKRFWIIVAALASSACEPQTRVAQHGLIGTATEAGAPPGAKART